MRKPACVVLLLILPLARPAAAQQAEPTVVSNLEQASKALTRGAAALPGAGSSQPVLVPEDFSLIPLSPGTLLDLRVYRVPEMSGTLRVDERGLIQVPLLGRVSVAGKTPAAVEQEVARRFVEEGLLVAPQINLDVLQYAEPSTTVLGEVQMPGRIALQAPKPLPAVLAMVGGETIAAGTEIEITHAGEGAGAAASTEHARYLRDVGPASIANVIVHPGDTVFVRRAGIVYVLGAVTRPGGYLMVDRGALDLIQAIALAQGTTVIASTRTVWVVRKQPSGITEIPVAYSEVVRGKTAAPILQPEDVVYVGVSKLKATVLNGSAVLSAATSAAIYAGTGH